MNPKIKAIIICIAMISSAGLATVLKPKAMQADQTARFDLETLIPKQFAHWHQQDTFLPFVQNPEVKKMIDTIYNQTLSRTYVNDRGETIMLTIAYGSNQSDELQVHKPEVCYPAQGFSVSKRSDDFIKSPAGTVSVKRLLAVQGQRNEPITYWIRVGDQTVLNRLSWKLAQMKYTLTGSIPDGLLFRVSSINNDENNAYALQKSFIVDLLSNVNQQDQIRLIGKPEMITHD